MSTNLPTAPFDASDETEASDFRITLDEPGGYLPGSTLTGRAAWRTGQEPASVEIRLFWYTSGKGTRDVGIVDTLTLDRPRAAEERPFSFVLPRGPYSFSGKLISLSWAIELIVSGGLDAERREFVLSPSRKELVLPLEVV